MDRLPTHEDANLILRLYEMRREPTMREARSWFVANYYVNSLDEASQVAPIGSKENAYVRMVTSYWEMVASFIANGVLSEDLFFQSGQEMLLTWIRVKPILPDIRKLFGGHSWKNLETIAGRYIEYLNRTAPGAFESFSTRMGTKPEVRAQKSGD